MSRYIGDGVTAHWDGVSAVGLITKGCRQGVWLSLGTLKKLTKYASHPPRVKSSVKKKAQVIKFFPEGKK